MAATASPFGAVCPSCGGKETKHIQASGRNGSFLRCLGCRHRFSSTAGTPLFYLHITEEKVKEFLLALLPARSIRAASLSVGIAKDTGFRLVRRIAGNRSAGNILFKQLGLNATECEAIWKKMEARLQAAPPFRDFAGGHGRAVVRENAAYKAQVADEHFKEGLV